MKNITLARMMRGLQRCAAALAISACAIPSLARADNPPLKVGILGDMSGGYSDFAGMGGVIAARMAIEDFGPEVLGRKIELLVGDHGGKPDVGLAMARQWYSDAGVDLIVGVGNSALSFAVQSLATEKNKIVIHTAAGAQDLYGKSCAANGLNWAGDNWANAFGLMRSIVARGKKKFFFITVNYVFGRTSEEIATQAIVQSGGVVVGSVKHPLETTDFSSYLLQAKASGADVIVLASGGANVVDELKQANEFEITPSQEIVVPTLFLTDIGALGLKTAQGLQFMQSWYWDFDDANRAFAKRFMVLAGKAPTDVQAAFYSAVTVYLKAVRDTGTADVPSVLKAMKAAPIHDIYARDGQIRPDGKLVFSRYLMRVKAPSDSRYPWDFYSIEAVVPPQDAFRPLSDGDCPLAR